MIKQMGYMSKRDIDEIEKIGREINPIILKYIFIVIFMYYVVYFLYGIS